MPTTIVRTMCLLALAAIALTASATLRFLWLDRLPGINGDEAWYGVQVVRLLSGEPWSAFTPSGLPVNPLLFLSELALHAVATPSFLVLRLPVALWGSIAIAITYYLHVRAYGDRVESLTVAALTACLPTHLAYSRFCWDSSFAFVSVPVTMYSTIELASGSVSRRSVMAFTVGSILTVWIHVTNLVFVAACLMLIATRYRHAIWLRVRRRPISAVGLVIMLVVCLLLAVERSSCLYELFRSALSSVERLLVHLRSLGDVVIGPRVYEYLAGEPRAEWTAIAYPTLLIATLAIACWVGWFGIERDRRLMALAGWSLLGVLLTGRALNLDETSYERYVLYTVPLAGTIIVRLSVQLPPFARWVGGTFCRYRVYCFDVGATRGRPPRFVALPLIIALVFVAQFWRSYIEPLRDQTNPQRLHRTFHTSIEEPKEQVAAAIAERSGDERPVILFEDWWVHYPVAYRLAGRLDVLEADRSVAEHAPAFVVGFAGSEFMAGQRRRLGTHVGEQLTIADAAGRPCLELLVVRPTPRVEWLSGMVDDRRAFP